jgi:hypothetical protein
MVRAGPLITVRFQVRVLSSLRHALVAYPKQAPNTEIGQAPDLGHDAGDEDERHHRDRDRSQWSSAHMRGGDAGGKTRRRATFLHQQQKRPRRYADECNDQGDDENDGDDGFEHLRRTEFRSSRLTRVCSEASTEESSTLESKGERET